MSFQSKSDAVLNLQLAVQELSVQLGDAVITANSASDVTIDFGETINKVVTATFLDNSAGTAAPIVASSRVVSGTTVKFTLSAPFAANDAITVRYVIE